MKPKGESGFVVFQRKHCTKRRRDISIWAKPNFVARFVIILLDDRTPSTVKLYFRDGQLTCSSDISLCYNLVKAWYLCNIMGFSFQIFYLNCFCYGRPYKSTVQLIFRNVFNALSKTCSLTYKYIFFILGCITKIMYREFGLFVPKNVP